MRYVEVGGVRLSAIGLGTWQFGSREWGYGEGYARADAGAIVDRALELGVNLVDTAEIYGTGRSERIVGEAIRGRREQGFVASKLFPVLPIPAVIDQRARGSVRRLGVDAIDLYQIHQPNPAVPLRLQLEGMRRVQREGLVRHIGVSNFSLRWWRRAEAALGGPVLSNQVRFSLASLEPLHDLVPHAAATDRLVIAYSPLGQGLLSGRYDEAHRPSGAIRRTNPLFSGTTLRRAADLIRTLREVAEAHGATPTQVALAWVIRRPNVVAIPGASSVRQVESNAEAASLELTDEEDARLTDAAVRFRPPRGLAAVAGRIEAALGR